MFAGFRKYQKWIWIVAIIVVIPSFVIFFSPDARWRRERRAAELGSIEGKPITPEEYLSARAEAYLSFFFRHGQWPDKSDATRQFGFDEERETYGRLLMLAAIRKMNIHVSPESAAKLAAEFFQRVAGTNAPPKQVYEALYQRILRPNGLTKADFERYIRNEAAIFHLVSIAGLPGRLVTPQEAESLYRYENQEVLVDVVFFSASNFLANVAEPDDGTLSQFFTNNMANYRLKERVQVAYVKFEMTNYLAEADQQLAKITNLTQQLREVYLKRGTNFYKDENGKVLSEQEALERIKKEYREGLALESAQKKAFEFLSKIPENALTLPNFLSTAASNNLTVQYTEPFDESGPDNLRVPESFTKIAFSMTKAEPISMNPIVAEDGVYVIALRERFESTIPPLTVIKDKVIQDYKRSQAIDMAHTRGRIFYASLTNSLAMKKSFSEICLESKFTPISLPPFSRSTRALENMSLPVSLNEIKRYAFDLEPGEVSQFIPTREGGMIIYMRSKLPIDEQKMKKELPQYIASIQQSRIYEAADLWLQKQRQSMQMVIPEKKSRTRAG